MRAPSYYLLLTLLFAYENSFAAPTVIEIASDTPQRSYKEAAIWSKENSCIQYLALAERFNSQLAGHYPFGKQNSTDAPLLIVRNFFIDYARQADSIKAELAISKAVHIQNALKFLRQLDEVASVLRESTPPSERFMPIRLNPVFRILANHSPGSNQIIQWSLSSDTNTLHSLNNANRTLDWEFGQPLIIDMTWASGSLWRPQADADYPDLEVNGVTASFVGTGTWALLRLIDAHHPKHLLHSNTLKPGSVIMEFIVPVQDYTDKKIVSKVPLFISLKLTTSDAQHQLPIHWPEIFPQQAPPL